MKSEYIDENALAVVLSVMRWENALAVRVSLATGLRIGDVVTLRAGEIDENRTIHKIAAKTNKKLLRHIDATLYGDLELSRNGGEWYFPSARASAGHRTRQAVWRDIRRAATVCAVRQHVTPHTARKVYAVEHFKRGGLDEVQKLLQHDSVTTTMLYAFADKLAPQAAKKPQIDDSEVLRFLALLVNNLGGYAAVERALRQTLKVMSKSCNV